MSETPWPPGTSTPYSPDCFVTATPGSPTWPFESCRWGPTPMRAARHGRGRSSTLLRYARSSKSFQHQRLTVSTRPSGAADRSPPINGEDSTGRAGTRREVERSFGHVLGSSVPRKGSIVAHSDARLLDEFVDGLRAEPSDRRRENWCRNAARCKAIHPDTQRCQLCGHAFGEMDDRGFRGAVRHHAASGLQPTDRCDVDDA